MVRVLIIDSDEAIRDTLRLFLEEEGFLVMEIASPADALNYLLACPDRMVVLFDAGIPRVAKSQVTALDYANDVRLLRHAYVCLTTMPGYLHPDLYAALAAQSVPIIQKPFNLDRLLDAVTQAATSLVKA